LADTEGSPVSSLTGGYCWALETTQYGLCRVTENRRVTY